ncbi:MAG: phosphoribosylglycinamide formyltransferase [Bacteroidota bacterium]|nr:phosphoribosylglycinamide formyltransferase [Bacteroidota bacterium]
MTSIAIFASGSGTNTETIIKYFEDYSNIGISVVISDNPRAYVLKRAEQLKVPALVLKKQEYSSGSYLVSLLRNYSVDFIVLAGYLKLIPSSLISAFSSQIVNIHPALLPKYGGKGMYGDRVHRAVIAANEKESGITIHFVNNKYDDGQIIAQHKCPVYKEDTPDALARRIHHLEHWYYPMEIAKLVKKSM